MNIIGFDSEAITVFLRRFTPIVTISFPTNVEGTRSLILNHNSHFQQLEEDDGRTVRRESVEMIIREIECIRNNKYESRVNHTTDDTQKPAEKLY